MAQIHLQIGETVRIQAPVGQIARWESSAPQVATVTDEDLTTGRAGGLVEALASGEAQIRAIGFNQEVLVNKRARVEGRPCLTVAVGDNLEIPNSNPDHSWQSSNSAVLAVTDSQLRGITPGIVTITRVGSGQGVNQHLVKVTGTLQTTIGSTVNLQNYFSLPVSSWQCGSTRVHISPEGTVRAADRPCTVEITATFQDGSSFQFDFQTSAQQNNVPISSDSVEHSNEQTTQTEQNIPVDQTSRQQPRQRRTGLGNLWGRLHRSPNSTRETGTQYDDFEQHLENARNSIDNEHWAEAKSELVAIELLATNNPARQQQRQKLQQRYQQQVTQVLQTFFENFCDTLDESNLNQAEEMIQNSSLFHNNTFPSRDLQNLVTALREIEVQQLEPDGCIRKLEPHVLRLCQSAKDHQLQPFLIVVTMVAMQFGIDSLIPEWITLLTSHNPSLDLSYRKLLERALADFDQLAVEQILQRMSQEPSISRDILYLLLEIHPNRHGKLIADWFKDLSSDHKKHLVEHLLQLRLNAPDDLLGIIAAPLQTVPRRFELIETIVDKLGRDDLEKLAVKSLNNGSAAEVILVEYFGYSRDALTRWTQNRH